MDSKNCFSRPQTICWNCANATGNCAWSDHNRHEPVEGWQAIRRDIHSKAGGDEESYIVVSCPEFKRDAMHGGAVRYKGGSG